MKEIIDHNVHTWNKLVDRYEERFMDLTLYDGSYDAFCELLPERPVLLELGCGPGNISRYMLLKFPMADLLATDAAPAMVTRAAANNPKARTAVLDCRDISSLAAGYDGIIAGFCIPYLPPADCFQVLHDCKALLNPKGVLYLSFIEGTESGLQFSSDGKESTYVYQYEEEWITSRLSEAGFEMIHTIRIPYTGSNGISSAHMVIISRNSHGKHASQQSVGK